MVRLKYSTIPLTSQVGGHSGVQTSEDGSLIFKPAVPLELQFYQSALTNPVLAPLRPFIPKFYGTLKLEGQIDTERTAAAADITVTHVHHETLGPKDKYSRYKFMNPRQPRLTPIECTFLGLGELDPPIPQTEHPRYQAWDYFIR